MTTLLFVAAIFFFREAVQKMTDNNAGITAFQSS